MLCLACGAEMRLFKVVENTTMLVSGYEHQTWLCSGCDSVEQRTTFSRKRGQTHRAPHHMGVVELAQTAAVELVQTESVEPAPIVPIQVTQPTQADPSQTT